MIGCLVHALDEIDSTQTALARLAAAGAPEGTVVTARHQTEGRGRRGRRWWDTPGDGLLLSVLLRPSVPVAHVPQLSLAAGLAVVDALEAAAGVAARIRWPNDVLIGGRKICGILAEAASPDDGRAGHVILGIGINVNQPTFPAELQARATSLRVVTGARWDTAPLMTALLDALDRRYGQWRSAGFAGLRGEWRRRSCTLGGRVRTPAGGEGVAVDVDDEGALLVDAGEGVLTRVVSGPLGDPSMEARDAAGH
jgi:BirA family biotin operon repressor/biotin-[acetyl-CoA-carboxylase] ligase